MESQIISRLLEMVNKSRKKPLTSDTIKSWIEDPSKDPKNKAKKQSDKPKTHKISLTELLEFACEKIDTTPDDLKVEYKAATAA